MMMMMKTNIFKFCFFSSKLPPRGTKDLAFPLHALQVASREAGTSSAEDESRRERGARRRSGDGRRGRRRGWIRF